MSDDALYGRPLAFAGLGLPVRQRYSTPGDQGIIRYWSADQDSINPPARHCFGFTLNTNGANASAFQSIGDFVAMEIFIGMGRSLEMWVGSGKVWTSRVLWANGVRTTVDTSTKVTIPTGFDNVDLYAEWDNTSQTGSRAYVSAGTNSWQGTLGSPVTSGSDVGADQIKGRVTIGQALNMCDVFYAVRNYYSTTMNVTHEAWRPAKYAAVLDVGRNRFTHMPSDDTHEAWDLITAVAAAEFGAVLWDENGIFHFWNTDTIDDLTFSTVRMLRLDDITGLKVTDNIDSVRNIYTVKTTKRRALMVGKVYESRDVDEFYVPPLTEKRFRIFSSDVLSPLTFFMAKYISKAEYGPGWPVWDENVGHGYCIQYKDASTGAWRELDTRTGVDVRVYFTTAGMLTVRVWNGWGEPIRFAGGSATDSATPAFRLAGTLIRDDDPQSVVSKDRASVLKYGSQNLTLDGPWYQDTYDEYDMVTGLLAATRAPRPTTDAITIAGDPRLQLGDTIGIADPAGIGDGLRAQIIGISRKFGRDSGLEDTLTVKLLDPVSYVPGVPAAPSNLVAVVTDPSVQLTWTGVPGATSYRIYDEIGAPTGLAQGGTVTTTSTVLTLANGTYRFKVTARNSFGESAASNTVTVTITQGVVGSSFLLGNPADGGLSSDSTVATTAVSRVTSPGSGVLDIGHARVWVTADPANTKIVVYGETGGSGSASTVGKTTAGDGSTESSSDKIIASKATAASSGALTAGHARVWCASSQDTVAVKMLVYADSGGAPGALVATSSVVTVSSTSAGTVYDFPFSSGTITAGTVYWIAVFWDDPGGTSIVYSRGTTASQRLERSDITYPTAPNPFGSATGTFTGPIDAWLSVGTSSGGSGGVPGSKLAESDVLAVSNTAESVQDYVFSGANRLNIVSGTAYYLGLAWQAPSGTGGSSSTLGKTTNGSSSSSSSGDKTVVSKVTASAAGTLTAGHARLWVDSGTAAVEMLVYADSGGAPGAKIATSNTVTISNTTEAQADFTFTGGVAIASGTAYWVGFTWADPGSNNIFWSRDATTGAAQTVSVHSPNPLGTPTALAGPIDAYVDVTAAGGGAGAVTLGRGADPGARQETPSYAPAAFGAATPLSGPVEVWANVISSATGGGGGTTTQRTAGPGGVAKPAGAVTGLGSAGSQLNITTGGTSSAPRVIDGESRTVGRINITADWVVVQNYYIVAGSQYGCFIEADNVTFQNNDIKGLIPTGDGDLNAMTVFGSGIKILYNTMVNFVSGNPGASHTDAIQTWVSSSHSRASNNWQIIGNVITGPANPSRSNSIASIHQCIMVEGQGHGGNSGGSGGQQSNWLICDNIFGASWNQDVKFDCTGTGIVFARNQFTGSSDRVIEDDTGGGITFYSSNQIIGDYGTVGISTTSGTGPANPYATTPGSGGGSGGGGSGGGGTGGGGTAVYPADLLVKMWYLTTPEWDPNDSSSTWNIEYPALATFVRSANVQRAFMLNASKTGIVMSSDYGGSHTPNSTNTRMELREKTANAASNASWTTRSGRHQCTIVTQVDRLDGNHMVIGQIHDANDDTTVFRLEGASLWITNGDTTHGHLVTDSYQLGTKITIKFDVASSGVCTYSFNGSVVWTLQLPSVSGCYFKAGAYLQRKGSPGSWGQVTLYSVDVSHTS